MPTGNPPIYAQPGNRRPVPAIGALGPGSVLFVIGANAFLNAGTIAQGDTVTAVTETAHTLLGNPTAAGAPAEEIPIGAGLTFNVGGSLDTVLNSDPLVVAHGGTGRTSLTAHNLLIGDGASPVNNLAPGSAGNIPVSDGTDWISTNLIKPPPSISAGATGSGTVKPSGIIYAGLDSAGIGNGADTTNDTLFTYTLPANSLDQDGRGIVGEAFGNFAGNGNDKNIQVFVDGVSVFTTGILTDNLGWWHLKFSAYRSSLGVQIGSVVFSHGAGAFYPIVRTILAGADVTLPVVITVTGSSPTTGAANDVVANGMVLTFLN